MKHCMKCGHDYNGSDGDMIDCPYCGEYGGNSWVYGNNGHMHAFSWDTPSGGSSGGSYGNASDGGGCAAVLGILFLISLAGPAMSCLWIIIKSTAIFLGCLILLIGLIILWDEKHSSGNGARSKKGSGGKTGFTRASSSSAPPSPSQMPVKTKQTAPPVPPGGIKYTITVTNWQYYKR